MAAVSIRSDTPGTQAFAAQPDASPALAFQGKHVGVTNALKIKLEKNLLGSGVVTGSFSVSILPFPYLHNFSSCLLVALALSLSH